jgi:hypothetical protein
MSPNDLRRLVREAIQAVIEPAAWARAELTEQTERDSIIAVIDHYRSISGQAEKYPGDGGRARG